MTVAVASPTSSTTARFSPRWLSDRLGGFVLHVVVIGLTVAWMVPTIGLLITSFRRSADISNTGWWTALSPPFKFTLDNYSQMFAASNLGQSLFNSFMISIPATVIPVTLAAFAAYAFAWMKFPGRDWIFLALVGLLAVPLQLTFIPVTTELVKLGLTPEKLTAAGLPPFIPLWLAHAGYGLPFSIYLLSNFFRALPSDLFESAEIDGAGTLTVFFRIVLPLSVPAIASLVGVIWAVTVTCFLGSMLATVGGLKVMVQLVGALAVGLTLVIGAVPVFAIVIWKSFSVPALAVVERTWSGVDTVIV